MHLINTPIMYSLTHYIACSNTPTIHTGTSSSPTSRQPSSGHLNTTMGSPEVEITPGSNNDPAANGPGLVRMSSLMARPHHIPKMNDSLGNDRLPSSLLACFL